MTEKGRIKVVYGPMFSDKTVTLIKTARESEKTTFPIKPIKDTRYGCLDEIVSNNPLMPKIKAHKIELLMDLINELPPLPCLILIDEGQFFDDLYLFSKTVIGIGYDVFIATLDTTFERELWKPIEKLFKEEDIRPHMDLTHLTSICYRCKGDAEWSKRIIASKELVVVGGNDSYVPCCSKCW